MATMPPGWLSSADGVSYPPAPWRLRGTAYVSLWRVPADELPAGCRPPGARPVSLFGRAVVGTAWAVYGPGGVLTYNEVLAAVRVRVRGRSYVTVTHIWVDHPSSLAGGRDLWGIPKQRATFQVRREVGAAGGADFEASAATLGGRPIAALRFWRRVALPGRWRLRTRTAQRPLGQGAGEGRGKDPKIAAAEALTSVELGAARWSFAPDGPLGFLDGREPFLSARLAEMSLRFG
jgi:hypothetical protein